MNSEKSLTISGLIAVASIVSGDFLMLAIAGLARQLTDGLLLQWLIATVIIALGSFLFIGIPEVVAWSKPTDEPRTAKAHTDPRLKMALRFIEKESSGHFVAASLLGGPLLIGFVTGRNQDPHAMRKTFISSWIMAVAWSAVYIGIIEAVTNSIGKLVR